MKMGRLLVCVASALMWGGGLAAAQHIPGYNYDEAKVPPYAGLDPLKLEDGQAVTSAKMWWEVRRPQILGACGGRG
jgi:hypothetical protein